MIAGPHGSFTDRMLFGGDYNPEQWPRAVWDEDMALMRRAGVNLATVGVFSWACLEPEPGKYEFGWLDDALDLLHANGIGVALATPTASAPPWLNHRWPQTLPQNPDGTIRTYGSRNAYCPTSPVYREFADRISTALAARYAQHPALRMWHIGNEFGTVCYCDRCAARFRVWLLARYGDLASLNEAWGTAFWSQRYSAWDEVIPPRQVQYVINPTQDLDYQRFSSDLLLEGFIAERDIVRAHNPDVPVTTNFMGFFKGTDAWAWAGHEDFVSVDTYPDPNDPDAARDGAMVHDLTRSLGRGDGRCGAPWLLMEQSPSAAGWRPIATPKRPGLNRLWSMQAVARGADGVLHFQWRASKQGAERTHGAMVPHAGPDSRVFREICDLGAELAALTDVIGTRVSADVAILHDWDAWRAVELDHQPHSGFRYLDRIREYYTPLWRANITTDFARPEAELSSYKLVLAPSLYQITDAAAENLTRYVERGGHLVVGPFSGVSDPDERIRLGGYPAPLRDVLGLCIEEYWPLPDDAPFPVRGIEDSAERGADDNADFNAAGWAEWLAATTAVPVAEYADGPLVGIPAVLRNEFGTGTAWYVATLPEPAALARLLRAAWRMAGVEPVLPGLPPGVEAVRRGDKIFLLDHEALTVRIEAAGHPGPPPPCDAEWVNLDDLTRLRRARDQMDRDYAQPLDLDALAHTALMSPGHFSRSFRAAYGETPYSYLMTRRVERAKMLLRRGDLSVTEVCFEVGCTSLGSFSARFTELVGETPSSYRARDHSDSAVIPPCYAKIVTRPVRDPRAKSAARP